MIKGTCLCGNVTVEIDEAPEHINICNCRFCRPTGAAWGYYSLAQVKVTGKTSTFRRSDIANPRLDLHFCPKCGATTHYINFGQPERDRMAVNTRLIEQDLLDGIETRYLDLREWEETGFLTTATGRIGDGTAF
jgi:hypothetical protein